MIFVFGKDEGAMLAAEEEGEGEQAVANGENECSCVEGKWNMEGNRRTDHRHKRLRALQESKVG